MFDLALQFRQTFLTDFKYFAAGTPSPLTQIQNVLDLIQCESKRLCLENEPQAMEIIVPIDPVQGRFALRLLQQTVTLIVPNGLDRNSTLFREFTDMNIYSLDHIAEYRVKPFFAIGARSTVM